MSHIVIRSVPFATRLRATRGGAKELLQRDRARAQKFLAGKSPHGPLPLVDEHRRRHHHKGTAPTVPSTTAPSTTTPAGTGGSSTGGSSSIDVTDSGVTYTMEVGVGNPATQYTLLIDTGQWKNRDVVVCSPYLSNNVFRQLEYVGWRKRAIQSNKHQPRHW
jgi:hypothetical protein